MKLNKQKTKSYIDCLSSNYDTVAILSTINKEEIAGALTISSFVSVSIEPKLVLFCINKDNFLSDIQLNQKISISFLSVDQEELSIVCSGSISHDDRIAGDNWNRKNGFIYNKNARFVLFCLAKDVIGKGSHNIIISEVNEYNELNMEKKPLIYGERKYYKIK